MHATATRRELLRAALLAAAGLVASPALGERGLPVGLARSGLVPDGEAARALGRLYRARHPEEATVAALCRRLGGAAPPATAEAWRRRIARAREADLAAGRCLELDGWLVASTEARLLALSGWH